MFPQAFHEFGIHKCAFVCVESEGEKDLGIRVMNRFAVGEVLSGIDRIKVRKQTQHLQPRDDFRPVRFGEHGKFAAAVFQFTQDCSGLREAVGACLFQFLVKPEAGNRVLQTAEAVDYRILPLCRSTGEKGKGCGKLLFTVTEDRIRCGKYCGIQVMQGVVHVEEYGFNHGISGLTVPHGLRCAGFPG